VLYLFDLDDTLIRGYLSHPDQDFNACEPLPGRRDRLAELLHAGHDVAIISNQRSVAFGFVSDTEVWAKLRCAGAVLGLPEDVPLYVCMHDVRGRWPWNDVAQAARAKPSGAMLKEAMRDLESGPQITRMIGDRPEDQQAATAQATQ
jgi:HAD superfamily hydrolase (TIGR01662 family)